MMPNKAKTPTAATVEVSRNLNHTKETNLMNKNTENNLSCTVPVKSEVVTIRDGELTTNSIAIADGVGNAHDTVIKLIDRNISDLKEFGTIGFEIRKSGGKPIRVAILNEQQSTLLLTYMRNNNVVREFKKKLVREFFTMAKSLRAADQQDHMQALNDPATMRHLLLGYTEKVIALEHKVEEMRPDVEAFDRIAKKTEGSMCLTDAAKHLQIKPSTMIQALKQSHWIYKRAGGRTWIGYQDKIQQGCLEHKVTTVSRSDGSEKIATQVLVTAKGLTKISQLLCGALL